ncbi:hypothetical protein BDZ97DRAFT_1759846 [Flammula alnicola]|nr:hypothetical protein BDZ97DRAFT_1759846 [Flammula alnicola]
MPEITTLARKLNLTSITIILLTYIYSDDKSTLICAMDVLGDIRDIDDGSEAGRSEFASQSRLCGKTPDNHQMNSNAIWYIQTTFNVERGDYDVSSLAWGWKDEPDKVEAAAAAARPLLLLVYGEDDKVGPAPAPEPLLLLRYSDDGGKVAGAASA